jgi:hypothetical protein
MINRFGEKCRDNERYIEMDINLEIARETLR